MNVGVYSMPLEVALHSCLHTEHEVRHRTQKIPDVCSVEPHLHTTLLEDLFNIIFPSNVSPQVSDLNGVFFLHAPPVGTSKCTTPLRMKAANDPSFLSPRLPALSAMRAQITQAATTTKPTKKKLTP